MKKSYKEFLPIGILDLIGVISIITVLTSEYIFGINQFIGLGLLMVSTILFFINRKSHIYFFGTTLILGLIGFVGFSVFETTFEISIIKIGMLPFIVLLMYVIVFLDDFKEMKNNRRKKEFKKLQRSFKMKFSQLSDKEIEQKLNSNLTIEALNALKEIKFERENESLS